MFALIVITKTVQILLLPLLASYFGTSRELECFFVAFSIPTLMLSTLLGSFGMVFIPLFTEQRLKYDEISAWNFASSLINIIIFLSIVITAISIICSPWLFPMIAPGIDPHHKGLGITLTRYLSVTILLFTGTVILTAVLNSYQSFILPAVVGLISNIVIVVTILVARQKNDVYVLGAAYLISATYSVGFLLLFSKNLWRNRYRFILWPYGPATWDALRMFMAASFIGILGQVILLANRYFASFLKEGSIAILEYASRVVMFTVELLAVSIVIPLYQRISREAASNDRAGIGVTFTLGIKMISVLLLPITLFMILFRDPIFLLLLEHGKFTSQNSTAVSSAFIFLSLAMVGNGFAQIVVSIFYAIKKTGLLLVLSACGVMLNIVLDAALYRPFGVNGLAAATGITAALGAAAAVATIRKEMEGLDGIYLVKFVTKIFSLAFLSCGLSWILFYAMGHSAGFEHVSLFLKLFISATLCTISYIIFLSYCNVEEINFILGKIKERLNIVKVN